VIVKPLKAGRPTVLRPLTTGTAWLVSASGTASLAYPGKCDTFAGVSLRTFAPSRE